MPPLPPPPSVAEIVVTAPRLTPDPGEAAFSVVVLPAAQLAPAPSLDQALEQVPGFSLFRRTPSLGANPTTQGASLRAIAGSGASRALVTLDGVPQNDPFGGWVIWTALPAEIVGEARIVRGAGSGPYGAGALTGVVALQSPDARAGSWNADLEGGSLGEARAEAGADGPLGPGVLALAASAERDDGWVPVRSGRGPADTRLTLADAFGQARWLANVGATSAEARLAAFGERRGSGLVGATSEVRGAQASVTAARPVAPGAIGWRLQAWATASDLRNVSVAVAPGRVSTSLADVQYATPALGVGANAAAREAAGGWTLEEGADARLDAGEDRERFHPVAGVLTGDRRAGGEAFVGGGYVEATRIAGPLTLALGGRLDGWSDFDGHRRERSLTSGASTLDLSYPSRGGLLPTGRAAVRYAIRGGAFVRAATYAGFRPPTLNELYRPFRVANNITEANPALVPERLLGGEIGVGIERGGFSVDTTVFVNRLDDAVANVTLRAGPFVDPVEGFIPAGGLLIQRRNIAAVAATGVEGEARWRPVPSLTAWAALDWTDARVRGGADAPALTGLRPAETPRWAANVGATWLLAPRWSASLEQRFESARFADDRNTLRLGPAWTLDTELVWRAGRRSRFFIAADNLTDSAVATDETADHIVSWGPPRVIRAGVRLND